MELFKKSYFIFLFSIVFCLQACSTRSSSQKLLNNIEAQINAKHHINYGKIIAVYDLAKIHHTQRIYSVDLGKMLNEDHYNTLFLKKFSGRFKNENNLKITAKHKIKQVNDLIMKLQNKYKFLNNSELRTVEQVESDPIKHLSKLDKILNYVPLMIPEYPSRVSSHYGIRVHPIKGQKKFHCGLDLVTNKSGAVYAAASGVVSMAYNCKGYGNVVEISHLGRFKTRYAHLKSIFVSKGEYVIRGQQVGLQGSTGLVTAEHLHFEIWLDKRHLNPLDFVIHGKI